MGERIFLIKKKKKKKWTSLVVQWIRIHLPMQGTGGLIPGFGRFHMHQGK